jgi:hypothetical protein
VFWTAGAHFVYSLTCLAPCHKAMYHTQCFLESKTPSAINVCFAGPLMLATRLVNVSSKDRSRDYEGVRNKACLSEAVLRCACGYSSGWPLLCSFYFARAHVLHAQADVTASVSCCGIAKFCCAGGLQRLIASRLSQSAYSL